MLPSRSLHAKRACTAILVIIMLFLTLYFAMASGYVNNLLLNFTMDSGSGNTIIDSGYGNNATFRYAEWTTDCKVGSNCLELWNNSQEFNVDNFNDASLNSSIWHFREDACDIHQEMNGYFRQQTYSTTCDWCLTTGNRTGFPNLNLNVPNLTLIKITQLNLSCSIDGGGAGCGAGLRLYADYHYLGSDNCYARTIGNGGGAPNGDNQNSIEILGDSYDSSGFINVYYNLTIIVDPANNKLYYDVDSADWSSYTTINIAVLSDDKKWFLGLNANTGGNAAGSRAETVIYDINYSNPPASFVDRNINFDPGSNNNFSILAWVRPRTTSPFFNSTGTIVSKQTNSTENRILLMQIHDRFRGIIEDNESNSAIVDSGSIISAGSWYHIGMVLNRDEQQLRLYVNGSLIDNVSTSSILNISSDFNASNDRSGALVIGGGNAIDLFFNGTLDNVLLYNDSLNATEVKTEYYKDSLYLDVTNPSYSVVDSRNGLVNYSFAFEPFPVDSVTCFVGSDNSSVYYGSQSGNVCVVNFTAPFDTNFTFTPSFNKSTFVVYNSSSFYGVRASTIQSFPNRTFASNLSNQSFLREYVVFSNSSSDFTINFSDGNGSIVEVTVPAFSSVRVNQSFYSDFLDEENLFYIDSSSVIIGNSYNAWKNVTFSNDVDFALSSFTAQFGKESNDFPTWQKQGNAQGYTYNATHLNVSFDSLASASSVEYRYGFYSKVIDVANRSAASVISTSDLTSTYEFKEQYVPFASMNLSNETLISTSFAIATYLPNWNNGSGLQSVNLSRNDQEINFSYSYDSTTFYLNYSNFSNANVVLDIAYKYTFSGSVSQGGNLGEGGGGEQKIQKIASLDVKPKLFTAWCFVFDRKDCFKELIVNRIDSFCSPLNEGFDCFVNNTKIYFGLSDVSASDIGAWKVFNGNASITSPGEEVGVYGVFRVVNLGYSFKTGIGVRVPKNFDWLFDTNSQSEIQGIRIFGAIAVLLFFVLLLWFLLKLRTKLSGSFKEVFDLEI